MRRSPVFFSALLVSLAACNDSGPPTQPIVSSARETMLQATGPVVPNRYVVVLRKGTASVASLASQMVTARGGRIFFIYEHALRGFAAELSPDAVAALRSDPDVDYIEQDQPVTIFGTQSPTPSWGLDRIDQRNLPLSHSYTYDPTGAGVHVYTIDTGILLTHSDFSGRASFGFDAIGDGFGQTDCNGHGTHVSGTIGGSTYGIAKDVSLVSVRVLDCNGMGTFSQVIAGVNWVTGNKILPAVANMSLGGAAFIALDQAVTNSIAAGVTYAIAAGNANVNACSVSPARTVNALTAAASDSNDVRASFSNFGSCVDIFAPGVAITSDWNTSNTATAVLSGTSMAAPHVAGAVALYLQGHPTAKPATVAYAISATATSNVISDPAGSINRLVHSALFVLGSSDLPPLSNYDFSCTTRTCTFDSNLARDDKAIVTRSWNFGDGGTASGLTASHTYAVNGTYTATLTVTDAIGQSGSATRTFTLPAVGGGNAGSPPIADFTAFPLSGTVRYDGSLSSDDIGIGTYSWDFGDGASGTGKTAKHTYSLPNQFYTVTLTVFDLAGQFSSKSIQVFPGSQ